jgi:uncharacterized membrane protein
LGLPTAFRGFLTYVTLDAIALFVRRVDRHWQYAWIVSFFGVCYSAYLTIVSLTILKATCPYCLTSLALMTTTFIVTTAQRPIVMIGFSWNQMLVRVVPVVAGAILLLHLNYTGVLGRAPSAEDPIASALADHLTNTGTKFYGASWCPHCQQQKELFGTAARRLPYVECSPEGRQGSPLSGECVAADIKSYPTWIFKGTKRVESVLTLKQLADETGFKAPAATP